MGIKKIAVAVIMAVCCACTAELDSTKEYVQLAATIFDKIDSKTTASDEGDKYSVTWTGTDIVSVNGQQSQAIEVDVDNPKRAVFTFGVVTPPYSSVYPASACKSVSGTTGTVYLPSEQKYVSGSFDPDAALMIGYSEEEGKVTFSHVVSYMYINVMTPGAVPVTSISVKGNGSERMSGDFSVDFKTKEVSSDATDGSSVTITAGTDGIPSGKSAMIAIPARTYGKGVTITVRYGNGKVKSLKSSRTFPAHAGVVYYTEVVLPDDRMFIEGLGDMPIESMDTWFEECVISTSVRKTLSLTPFIELNQSLGELNSHADVHERSSLKMMYSTLQVKGKDDGYRYPHYARIRKMSDGSYIQMWQTPSDEDASNGNKNGKDVYYSLSKDFKTWSTPTELFKSKNVYYDIFNRDTRHYSNGNGIVLSNGDFLAVACFRAPEIYNNESYKSYQGLAIRRSTDCGKSWSTEQIIYNGPCWEPHLMEVEEGVIHCYFAESRPWISGSHSGTSLVTSNDGGSSWSPAVGSEPYRVMRKKWYSEKDNTYFYTDQMAVGIKLNGTSQLAFAVECVDSRNTSNQETLSSSVVYSPENGQWNYLQGDEEASCDRIDKVGAGGAPYLVQFHSGETIFSYSASSDLKMYYKVGDEKASDFTSKSRLLLPYKGSWGGMEIESPHTLLASRYSSDNDVPALSHARFALNHNITASSGVHKADGDNSDWKNTDEALYVGSISANWATLRCSQDSDKVYFLIEVSDEYISSKDYVTLTLAGETEDNKIPYGARSIKVHPSGQIYTERYSSVWEESEMGAVVTVAYDGEIDEDGGDNGYIVEMEISRSSLPISDGRLLVNFAMTDWESGWDSEGEFDDYKTDAISSSSTETSSWIEVTGI
ncbi:MAG: exo-alpha-sialidase [Bacteroidales bacterium]|nr:exo-alpha-sialidase [Bacteroidales bacterium]